MVTSLPWTHTTSRCRCPAMMCSSTHVLQQPWEHLSECNVPASEGWPQPPAVFVTSSCFSVLCHFHVCSSVCGLTHASQMAPCCACLAPVNVFRFVGVSCATKRRVP